MALRVGAKHLNCTHHAPTRSDDELERVFADVMARRVALLNVVEVQLAHEGLEVVL